VKEVTIRDIDTDKVWVSRHVAFDEREAIEKAISKNFGRFFVLNDIGDGCGVICNSLGRMRANGVRVQIEVR
jgi:hypothetical protein